MIEPHSMVLPGGVRLLVGCAPHAGTCSVAVFVRWGSAHESARTNGIGHVLEHMAFKGTAVEGPAGRRVRDARQVNLEAERLGAEVNAHTDKDHTAFYMRGLPQHAGRMLQMLAEIVLHPSLPADELERERQVLLQEFAEDEDDPVSTAFKLFDKASFGLHPAAQPVMGTRRNLEHFTRDDLVAHRAAGYLAGNVVVGVVGAVRPEEMQREAERAFAAMPAGAVAPVDEPPWRGEALTRALEGSSQSHLVFGFPVPPRRADDPVATVAAALLGEGMSSPLLDRVRERRGLAYYTACSADVLDMCGQFVIEASMAADDAVPLLREVMGLLHEHARHADPADLERARQQLAVRSLRAQERGLRWLEDLALDWMATRALRPEAERLARLHAVSAADVSAFFERLLRHPPALALTGAVARGMRDRLRKALDASLG
ncbi:MAG: insulinase family protein [Burkholderiales bacterium]|nr:insulinase family protein [Burkholderiales bacterium]